MFGSFYAGKRILVTGAAGVKGTWLALALLEAGAEVTGVDIRLPDADSNFVATGLGSRIAFVHGDAADLALMRRLVAEVDAVFHLAALALVGDAERRPLEAYRSNTLAVATVLEALRLSPECKKAVFVTTDKVYQPKNGELWVETDPLGASGPYSVSKTCAELIIADYARRYLTPSGTLIGIARAGNVLIGGDLNSSERTAGAGRIFVDCFESLAQQRSPEIFSPDFTRPYTYGLDVIAGYMALMSKLDEAGVAGEAFNFGPYERQGISNALLATKLCDLWGSNIRWHAGSRRDEPFESQSLSCERSHRLLFWQPAFTFYETLQATTRWYKAWATQRNRAEGCMYPFNRELMAEHRTAAASLGIDWALETTDTGLPVSGYCLT